MQVVGLFVLMAFAETDVVKDKRSGRKAEEFQYAVLM